MKLPKGSPSLRSVSDFHTPALLNESLDFLKVKPGRLYFDLTVGGGGSSLEIIKRGGQVFALDQDPAAVSSSQKRLTSACPSGVFKAIQGNFNQLKEIFKDLKLKKPAGILLDLGTSFFQIKNSGRGFTFEKDEPLDMRMDPNLNVTAADLVNALGKKELAKLFMNFSQERNALNIAKKIVSERVKRPIKTTQDLVRLIVSGHEKRGRLHPATKVFQALRIAVNDELESLKNVLPIALEILVPKGRLVVISFHRLEDKIVKNFFKEAKQKGGALILTKKPVQPSQREIFENPRCRSARLRAIERI